MEKPTQYIGGLMYSKGGDRLNKGRVLIVGALLICGVAASLAIAQTKEGTKNTLAPVIDSLFAVRHIKQVNISPDGTHVAWVGGAIYVQDLKDSSAPARRFADGSDIAWSPDSTRLAFISDSHLYVAPLAGGQPKRITELAGFLAKPHWSPDGRTIAFLFTENAPRAAGPLEPMTPDTGVVEGHIYEQRLTTVDVATGKVRELTPADLYVYEYDWSSDGKNFAATAAHGNGDDNWYVAELYIISAASGQTNSIYRPRLQIAVPRWSPDGKEIAFIGGLMSDEGSTGGDIFVIPRAGGEPRDVTPGMRASASWLSWLPASREILAVEIADGSPRVARIDAVGDHAETLWTGPEVISDGELGSGLSLAADGKSSAVIRNSFQHPPEVWAGPLGDWKQVTHLNQKLRPPWGKAKSIHWSSDNFRVQGWLLYPTDFDPAKRYPLVVVVHGGPGSSFAPRWPEPFFNSSVLSSAGYFVLMPNPRGSFGQGEKFTQANVKDFGYGDLRDILAGVDEVEKTLPVDNDRIGITGWSYGGFMSMWAVTQTHRFHAAVVGAGLANWQSYYGENDLDQWMIPFFGASVYDDPAVYARSSPINFIKNVHTPSLILAGDRDGECPAPQSYEFWHALKTLGVKTQFVVYANEGHYIAKPEDERDIIQRMVGWFDRFLK
ncbi:MAG TPA: S9 family peptidase [Terriglobia bacterium]|nr:S9 family peptidase [Terriglobia bacterium]